MNIHPGLKTAIAALVIAAELGCVTEPSTTTTNTNSGANTNATAASPPPPAPTTPTMDGSKSPNDLQFTLPVLDAFFAQENFKDELKSKLRLTDQQINKLETIARAETAKLRETDNQAYPGTARAARENAFEQIKAAI